MQYGAMNNPMIDIIEEIDIISDLGFDFIDLTMEPEETYSGTVDASRVKKALDRTGLNIIGHTAWYLPVASPFPRIRELAIEELETCLKVFRDLGAKRMNMHPHTRVPLHDEDWIIAQNVEAISRLADLAKTMDMKILVENMHGFSRVSQFKPIMEAVPDAELLIDVGHANLDTPYNRSEELLANYGDRLGHIHVSDNRGGHDDMHLPLGVGNINWLKVVRLLKNVGYDQTITLEVFGDDEDYLVMSRDKIKILWDSTEAGEQVPIKSQSLNLGDK